MSTIIIRKPTEEEIKESESWDTWEKEPSEFDWTYDKKETCLILEGLATVMIDGDGVEFGKGDLVIFPKGLECTWFISEKIKKHYRFD